MNTWTIDRLALRLDRLERFWERRIGNVQNEFTLLCPFKQVDGRGHFVVSWSRVGMNPVRFDEHMRHLLFQELTRVRRPDFTGGNSRQNVKLNDIFELLW